MGKKSRLGDEGTTLYPSILRQALPCYMMELGGD